MDGLENLKSSPALQLLKQLDAPLSIAMKTATQFDWALNDGPFGATSKAAQERQSMGDELAEKVRMAIPQQWVSEVASLSTALKTTQQNWARDRSSMATAWTTAQAAWAFHATQLAGAIEVWQQDLARETASIAAVWKTTQAAWSFDVTPTVRALEAIQRDYGREATSIAASWKSIQQACAAVDTAPISAALKAAEAYDSRIAPVWAASISLEMVKPPKAVISPTTQVQPPDNSLLKKPFSDYGMVVSYNLLSDFERNLRRFIHKRMSDAYGLNWEKDRLPREMYDQWQEKRKKAIVAGESMGPLIDYADFGDYVKIIARKDHWAQVFKVVFGRPEFVQESLYRLQPIRVCTMHARVLPNDLQLVLQVEVMQFSKRMWN